MSAEPPSRASTPPYFPGRTAQTDLSLSTEPPVGFRSLESLGLDPAARELFAVRINVDAAAANVCRIDIQDVDVEDVSFVASCFEPVDVVLVIRNG